MMSNVILILQAHKLHQKKKKNPCYNKYLQEFHLCGRRDIFINCLVGTSACCAVIMAWVQIAIICVKIQHDRAHPKCPCWENSKLWVQGKSPCKKTNRETIEKNISTPTSGIHTSLYRYTHPYTHIYMQGPTTRTLTRSFITVLNL